MGNDIAVFCLQVSASTTLGRTDAPVIPDTVGGIVLLISTIVSHHLADMVSKQLFLFVMKIDKVFKCVDYVKNQ